MLAESKLVWIKKPQSTPRKNTLESRMRAKSKKVEHSAMLSEPRLLGGWRTNQFEHRALWSEPSELWVDYREESLLPAGFFFSTTFQLYLHQFKGQRSEGVHWLQMVIVETNHFGELPLSIWNDRLSQNVSWWWSTSCWVFKSYLTDNKHLTLIHLLPSWWN